MARSRDGNGEHLIAKRTAGQKNYDQVGATVVVNEQNKVADAALKAEKLVLNQIEKFLADKEAYLEKWTERNDVTEGDLLEYARNFIKLG